MILIVIDTLRADALSCYGGKVDAPAICGLGEGRRHDLRRLLRTPRGRSPSFASLLTSTLPSTHNAMSKTATLSPDLDLVSEVLQKHGYATGGIVANINLAPSFGFEQGYDEYRYLGARLPVRRAGVVVEADRATRSAARSRCGSRAGTASRTTTSRRRS